MFTGLIQGVGRLRALEPRGGDVRIHIDTGSLPFTGVAMGAFRHRFMPLLLRHRGLLTVLALAVSLYSLGDGDAVAPGPRGQADRRHH